jgi:aryl-alcohol dehydrogenase (NADP+)
MYSLGAARKCSGRALRDFASRDAVVIATKAYYAMSDDPERSRALAQAPDGVDRRIAPPSRHRLRRPVPDSPLDEERRSRRRCARSTTSSQRQGALHRRVQHDGVAVHEGADDRRSRRLDAFVSMQNHYNLIYREEEREMMPLCVRKAWE